jgi:hypothetical protein
LGAAAMVLLSEFLFLCNRSVGRRNRGLNGDYSFGEAFIAIRGAIPFHKGATLLDQFGARARKGINVFVGQGGFPHGLKRKGEQGCKA